MTCDISEISRTVYTNEAHSRTSNKNFWLFFKNFTFLSLLLVPTKMCLVVFLVLERFVANLADEVEAFIVENIQMVYKAFPRIKSSETKETF